MVAKNLYQFVNLRSFPSCLFCCSFPWTLFHSEDKGESYAKCGATGEGNLAGCLYRRQTVSRKSASVTVSVSVSVSVSVISHVSVNVNVSVYVSSGWPGVLSMWLQTGRVPKVWEDQLHILLWRANLSNRAAKVLLQLLLIIMFMLLLLLILHTPNFFLNVVSYLSYPPAFSCS